MLMSVTVQISTNVLKTTEVVVLMPAALTHQATPPVPVYLDTSEMDSTVHQVNIHKWTFCNVNYDQHDVLIWRMTHAPFFFRFLMYCFITGLPVAFYSEHVVVMRYITNLTKRWLFAVSDVQLRRLSAFFYKLRFLRLYLQFFYSPVYAEVSCLQHFATYHQI